MIKSTVHTHRPIIAFRRKFCVLQHTGEIRR